MTKKHQLHRFLPLLLILLPVILAFSSGLQGEFFEVDDVESIRDNPHIRRLWPLSEPLCLPLWNTGATVDTRPVLALSLALNYQLTGDAPWGFHLINILVHLASALLLFGIVRRTLAGLPPASRPHAVPAAFAAVAAMVWAVHPLQTEAVTYTVQRAVSLMGMFYLLTLYASIRASSTTRPRLWPTIAVIACALGMGTKESMVTAPILVMLYDYVFSGQKPAHLWRQRRGLYLGLISTWIIMILLVAATFEGMSRDASTTGVLRYAASQPLVILKYLRLAFWPRGLVLDYTNHISQGWQEILLPALPLAILFVFSLIGTIKRRPIGFLGLAFFVLLAPSSSIAPTLNVYNEHRMYLALAMVVVPVLWGVDCLLHRAIAASGPRKAVGALLLSGLISALAAGTFVRNLDWRTAERFWIDNIEKRPRSGTAHSNLGNVLLEQGCPQEAIRYYREAIRLQPQQWGAHNNMGNALLALGRPVEAIPLFQQALRLKPGLVEAHLNLGNALLGLGHVGEATKHYRVAIQLRPDLAEAHYRMGDALLAVGRLQEALPYYREALRRKPDDAEAHYNLGVALIGLGRPRQAIPLFQQALRLKPGLAGAHLNLGNALLGLGQVSEATKNYRLAIKLRPDFAEAHNNLGAACRESGQRAEAIRHFEQAVRLKPDYAVARENLRVTRGMVGEGTVVEDGM